MELGLHRLRMLHELARRGTVTETAKALHYTPSAVSQQLGVLEKEVGAALFERIGRRLRLTETGRLLAAHAEEILDAEERTRIALEEARTTITGELTVGVFATVAAALLPGILAHLAEHHPGVGVVSRETDPEDAVAAIRHGDLDLAFVLDYPDTPGGQPVHAADFSPTLIGVEPLYAVTRRGAFPAGGPIALAALAEQPWIVSGPGSQLGRTVRVACQDAGFLPRVAHQIDEHSTAMVMVAAGLGVTLVPGLSLPLAPPGVDISPLVPSMRRRIFLAGRHPALRRPALRAFLGAAVATAAGLDLGTEPDPAPFHPDFAEPAAEPLA
ncbi:MAG TPA: LysR substrate-binding domain-containing protein [Streptosporangiaceae bacterium]|jgi:DNA-binding transcriptional LysR family regulator